MVGAARPERDIVRDFEAALARRSRHAHASTFASGREALMALCTAMGLKPGDEIVLPAFICPAVRFALIRADVEAVPCEIEPRTLGPSIEGVRKAISVFTRAILVPHLVGHAARDLAAIARLAQIRGIPLIEDCAHITGLPVHKPPVGNAGLATIHSFESSKPVPCGRGGAVTTDDERLARKLAVIGKKAPSPDAGWIRAARAAHDLALHPPKPETDPALRRRIGGTSVPPTGPFAPPRPRRLAPELAAIALEHLQHPLTPKTGTRDAWLARKPFGPPPDGFVAALKRLPIARAAWAGDLNA